MLNWFKKKKKEESQEYSFQWYEIGEDNPFNKKVLDIRSYTQTVLAFTKYEEVAIKYNELRSSLGKELISFDVSSFKKCKADLEYKHNGEHLEGVAFKADSMDCKWDIYAYDDYFFFSSSWEGQLIYKAKYLIEDSKIKISEIFFPDYSNEVEAINDVHYLIKSHATGQAYPHKVPEDLKTDIEIAQWSFVKFGNRAYYASYEDITDTIVTIKENND